MTGTLDISGSDRGTEGAVSFPEGEAAELDARGLRELAEGISREFAPRLERTALVLYDRDPEHLQAQWYVAPRTLAEARDLFPGERSGLSRVLRLCRLDPDGRAEVVASIPGDTDNAEEGGWGDFARHGDGAEYVCELGLESEAGGWLLLARSNPVRPADRNPPTPRIVPVPKVVPARNAAYGPAEEPEGFDGIPVEAALAAVGGPLYPVFPNLDPEPDVPLPGRFPSLEEPPVYGRVSQQATPDAVQGGTAIFNGDQPLKMKESGHHHVPIRQSQSPGMGCCDILHEESGFVPDVPPPSPNPRPDIPSDFEASPEPADEEACFDADLAALPPLLPPSPAEAGIPGSLYDPRVALSSAVLGGLGSLPSDDGIRAELIVQGEAPPGSTIELLGQPVPVGRDGRFYARCPIGDPARLSLTVDGHPPSWWEPAGQSQSPGMGCCDILQG